MNINYSSYSSQSVFGLPGKTCGLPIRVILNQLLKRLSSLLVVFACSGAAVAQVAIQTSVSTDQNSPSTKISSPAFSTSTGNQLLLAFIAADNVNSPNTTVQSVTGAGLTWVMVKRTNAEAGTSEIWRAFAPAVLSNVRVTASLSHRRPQHRNERLRSDRRSGIGLFHKWRTCSHTGHYAERISRCGCRERF